MERVAGVQRDRSWSRRFSKLFLRDRSSPGDAELPRRASLSLRAKRALHEVLQPNEVHEMLGHAYLEKADDAEAQSPQSCSQAYLLAVASGKGGTGKSFLATNLSVALHSRGHRVTLVDCDFGMANDHLLMGVHPERSIEHFFAGSEDLADVVTRTPYGPSLLPGGSGLIRLGDLTEVELLQFARGLSSLAVNSDIILMDSAAGMSAQRIVTLLSAEHVVLVINPEIAALHDAYCLIKTLAGLPKCPRVSVVVNRVASGPQGAKTDTDATGPEGATGGAGATERQGRATFQKLSDVVRRYSHCEIHYLGAIPEEPAITHLRLNQPPLVISHPTCQASRAIQEIRDRLDLLVGSVESRSAPAQQTIEQRFKEILGHPHLRH